MEEIVLKGSELGATDTTRSCGHRVIGNANTPALEGTRRHGGPEMKAAILASDVPGPFGAGATDGTPGTAWDAAGGFHDSGLALTWGYLPPSDDHAWVLGRTTPD